MARIRTIKPEFWGDEKLGPLDPTTRLVFLGLVSMADDAGRLIDSIRSLDGMIFPHTEDTCAEALDILARLSRITRYTSESGQRLIQICGWETHQKVDRPAKHVLPPPPRRPVAAVGENNPRDILATSSRHPRAPTMDLGPTTMDHGSGTNPPPPLGSEEISTPEVGTLDSDPPPDGSTFIHPTQRMSGSEILNAWESIQPGPVSEPERKKQRHIARKIADQHTADEVRAAMVGMTALFPHCPPKNEPWDLFDLDRKFSKAIAKARDHPDLRAHREIEAFLATQEAR